ncbi:hypothetical protein D9V80_01430 [Buchnera aphidicola (Thelaxes californica)]|uniref:Reactive intermediate/imine deaminase n=1 Tax=Buchnera aphidicola (Thelaxes californica) TaxID=1315998 RepID=A0A4D6Y9W7_9GAMM|nr:Rid family detoxifying hydrolase [Buchnera aphidicola]QCI26816.1 hypothetical protein D9V80_01430 [Buchnera aphidicola (Thelaxes californica)]
MTAIIINTKHAPQPIGPYNQGICNGNILYISGQIPTHTLENVDNMNIQQQTQIILSNIKNIILKANFSVNNIIKTTIFLTKIKDLQDVNKIYKIFFQENNSHFPTRSCIEVNNLPKNAKIEIEAIAMK